MYTHVYILLDILLYINCSSTMYTYHTVKYAADVLAGPSTSWTILTLVILLLPLAVVLLLLLSLLLLLLLL